MFLKQESLSGDQTKAEPRSGAGKICHDVRWGRGHYGSAVSIENKMITENPEALPSVH